MAFFVVLSLVVPAAADPSCPFGVNAHQAEDAALDAAAAAGVGWVRFDFNWFQFEPAQDSFDWTIPDRFVDHAVSLGLEVYPSIGYTPAWAAGSACDDASPDPDEHCLTRLPAARADWEDFVRQAVQRYGDRVTYWGVWNEPNLSQFFAGSRDEWVAEILRPAADTIHAECPTCKVVGPELANLREAHWDADEGVCAFNECLFNGWDYSLEHVLTDAGDVIDVVSHHKYSDPADAWWEGVLEGEFLVVQYMHGVRELTDAHAPGKPVWITEFGWETPPGGNDPVYAADQLEAVYSALPAVRDGTYGAGAAWPELQALFWYDLHDDPSGPAWGLLDAGLVPKPAYDRYAATIGALGGCAAFAPGGTTTTTTTTTAGTTSTADTGTTGTGTTVDTTPPGTTPPGTTPPGTTPSGTTPPGTTTGATDAGGAPDDGDPKDPGCGCGTAGAGEGLGTGLWGGLAAAALALRARSGSRRGRTAAR